MSNESKFKHTLQQWELSERLRHQERGQKSLVRKITYEIKKIRKKVISFFYLNFLLRTKFKKTASAVSANNTAIAQTYTLGKHVNKCTLENKKVLAVVIHAFYFDIFYFTASHFFVEPTAVIQMFWDHPNYSKQLKKKIKIFFFQKL